MTAWRIDRITVFTGSAIGRLPGYAEETSRLGTSLADQGIGVVYGGGKVGLMGVLADSVLAAGGRIHGVMPRALVAGEIAHDALTHLDVVPDMHARKLRMGELADAFIALPGGAGTLEELFEVWTWQQLGVHSKPIALYDVAGYWRPLIAALDAMVEQGFLAPRFRNSLIVADSPPALFHALDSWTPQSAKWS